MNSTEDTAKYKKKSLKENAAVKFLPHNLEAEVAILGGILIYNESLFEVNTLLSEKDFYREVHRIIYRRMLDLEKKSEPIDAVTLGNLLDRNGELQRIGGVAAIANIINAVSTSAGILSYAKIVRDHSIKRQLIFKCSEITEECFSGTDEVSTLLDKAEHRIFSIKDQQKTEDVCHLNDALNDVFSRITNTREGGLSGLPTGFDGIDELILGMQPSNLIILAARPGMGKTALALNIAHNAVKKTIEKGDPKAVLVFSLEMSKAELATRLLSLEAGINGKRLKGGNALTARETESLVDAASRLSEMPIFIDDSSAVKPLDMKAKCRRVDKENKLGLIVVDYLQLVKGDSRPDSPREQEIASVSRTLKGLAKEMNLPVLALSQLNRGNEVGNKNLRPQLSNLRESGAIEQDADIVMFIHSERDKETDLPIANAEVIIAKQRNGPTGIVNLYFQKEYTRFRTIARRDNES